MSYTNGILNHDDSQGLGKIGSRGLPGIGFKLDANNDYDMQNKKLVNVKQGTNNNDVVTKSQLDSEIAKIPSADTTQFVKKTGATMNGDLILQPQPYPIHGNTDKAISYNTARNIFLSKKEGGSMLQSLDMNNHFITNIKDPVNSDHRVNKKYVDNQLAKKLDKDTTIDMKDNAITNVKFPVNQKDVATVEYITQRITNSQKNYLKLDGTTSMSGDLNLNNNKIINLQTDSKNSKSAVNVELMENEITDLRNLVTQKIHESQIINSGQKKDAFRYLMENDDESSSELNIQVLGIVDFSNSPHQINKKAYQLKLLFQKSSPNQYQSRLGFNLYKLPVGYYTLVVEWFPPEMSELSVAVQGTTISISNYATKTFENYTKTVINFHRWGSSPPQFIYLDLHGTVTFPSLLTIGHLIVYGVKETISNVDPSVYDTAFVIENGKMVMETDLSLNGHNLRGSVHYINGILNTKNGNTFLLNGCDKIIIPNHSHILTITVLYFKVKRRYTPISLKVKHSDHLTQSITYTSTKATRTQAISINLILAFGHLAVELGSVVKNEELLLLIEYRVPYIFFHSLYITMWDISTKHFKADRCFDIVYRMNNLTYIYMRTAILINEILESIERLIKNIRTLYSNIKESFKKKKM